MVFNVCISNVDDHLRNHGFILTDHGWRISPAYDMNPIAEGGGLGLNISVDFFLIGPRFDLTFTDRLFLTTFVQYKSQFDNLNINTRFQWKFKPVSDLFVVYTDNYLPDQLKVKNRALVLKLSYWYNL